MAELESARQAAQDAREEAEDVEVTLALHILTHMSKTKHAGTHLSRALPVLTSASAGGDREGTS
eukprot:3937300-Rhodomonas_salina.3